MTKTPTFNRLATFACALLVLLSVSSCNIFNLETADTPLTAHLTIIPRRASAPIPSDMIGMNIELKEICSVLITDEMYGPAYEQRYIDLGKGTLHVGGHSANRSSWQPDGQTPCGDYPAITKSLIDRFFAFANRIHWHVIWELNFLGNNPHSEADEAAYITQRGGHTLIGFSFGNEPDLYVKHGEKPANWTFNDFISEWQRDRDIVLAEVPTAHFIGPDTTTQLPWLRNFLADKRTQNHLIAASRHYYFYSGIAHPTGLTPSSLFSQATNNLFIRSVDSWVSDAESTNLPLIISETNTVSNGGIRGVSNSFGASLWTSNMILQSAELGVQQVDFQQVPHAAYATINDQGVPQPTYYGMLFASHAIQQADMLLSVLNSVANVSVYALEGQYGDLRIVIINKETSRGIQVTVNPGSRYHTMAALRMQAPSFTATSGVALKSAAPVTARGEVVLSVPASSAALFTFSD